MTAPSSHALSSFHVLRMLQKKTKTQQLKPHFDTLFADCEHTFLQKNTSLPDERRLPVSSSPVKNLLFSPNPNRLSQQSEITRESTVKHFHNRKCKQDARRGALKRLILWTQKSKYRQTLHTDPRADSNAICALFNNQSPQASALISDDS